MKVTIPMSAALAIFPEGKDLGNLPRKKKKAMKKRFTKVFEETFEQWYEQNKETYERI